MIDPPRDDTAKTINSLHHANISVKMITGDHTNVAKETARLIGLGTDIHPGEHIRSTVNQEQKKDMIWRADGFAAVLPSDKREVVMTLRNEYGVVTGMTGDGVNDAPALSAAQVGIAVEGATDAAKNAADLILTEPGLGPIYGAVLESRRIFARVKYDSCRLRQCSSNGQTSAANRVKTCVGVTLLWSRSYRPCAYCIFCY
mmetsp:Transcript_17034/g.34047  ORF Transcript_17034/g.34047 Transcript_17034/m.34047 type:complete len:201 (+) Transcript_17034:1483-2085(+)